MIYSAKYKGDTSIDKEDTRTSTIIGTLLHLPDAIMWSILRNACNDNGELPVEDEYIKLEDYKFWPHWSAYNTENSNYVEPDVFLRFNSFDLMIEAKRTDWDMQDPDQWEKELQSYRNEYANDIKSIYLIALGGNGSKLNYEIKRIDNINYTIFKCSWMSLYQEITKKKDNYNGQKNIERVFESLYEACKVFGFRFYTWFNEIDSKVDRFQIDYSGDEKYFSRS